MGKILDVIIVGAGTAGLSALREVKKQTDQFMIINDGPWGTTCARVGCMPSKLLIEAANAFHHRNTFAEFGINGADSLTIDIPKVLRRVRKLRDDFVSSTITTTTELGKKAISGRARLIAPDTIEINGEKLRAHKIILATGTRPIIPEPWRKLGKQLLTTDTLFEQKKLPARIGVIGMGPIGVEMAQALSRLGIQVSAFGSRNTIAGISDPEINETAIQLLQKEFPIYLGSRADVVTDHKKIQITAGKSAIEVDSILVALGRQPNIDQLGLETLGITLNDKGMPSFNPNTLQIEDLPIFLAGDANGEKAILHEAADEGFIAGYNATRSENFCFKRRTPLGIIFCDPNIAIVGQRYKELSKQKNKFVIGKVNFANQGRARASLNNKGLLHVYANAKNGTLLGAEMCAPAGEHMAHLLALAIDRKLTVHQLLHMPFYHPVLEEGLRTALRSITAQLPIGRVPDLTLCSRLNTNAID
ncbi:MAG TPA: dihydrolipoyl dehydrogenase [Nitrosomonas sp.]|nr:dihydrolipoyl dehydrogenase [Nitrosomonas sp.]HQX13838.1 dihydrolipoyl dehydrogenase [Nitrosomonas sp.]HRB20874.1 dihydrolipoyl dehydrogenase [Nitrosomonas sp.]HRB33271.1 dihydrolipoyl dehydrogenase [Nitrosomonas sp.]HRB45734.1 dihydrolipoyl dehydrogenase [Nitrosomonas sp.]